jgi:pyruvate kinase
MSRHNIHVPIFALTPNVSTQRVLSTYRNVTPLGLAFSNDRDTALAQVEERLKKMGAVRAGDTIVLTVGAPMGSPGGTNTLKIINVK